MNIIIPVYKPYIHGNEKKYVSECINSGWISSKGIFVQKFENTFKDKINVAYAATVCNGTVAIHLALLALGIGPGDEVIVPTLTYIATVNAVTYTGAVPVFADSLNKTWQINPTEVKKKITSKTKAIIAVHLYGHPCEMDELGKIAKEKNLYIVEDCAEAVGSMYKKNYVGNFGDLATFSFYGNKTITTGEGGMIVSNNPLFHQRVMKLKGQGLAANREYWHDEIGYNYRMTNICAAIGLAQVEQIDKIIKLKRNIAKQYDAFLKDLPIETHREVGDVFHSYWMYNILVENAKIRDQLRQFLMLNGVETRPVFYPIHTMPMYKEKVKKYPVAEYLAKRGITLPSYPALDIDQIENIVGIIRNFYAR